MMNVEIELAGVRIRIALHFPETKKYFKAFIISENCDGWDIRVEEEDAYRFPLICPNGNLDPFSETYLLMPRASAFLLRYDRALIHGLAFVWRKKAWLITAPSGTGKTTQYRHWQHLFGDEIELINGDKTVLALHSDGSLWLHPSPWMGKEADTGTAAAPLGGAIILRQAAKNSIRRLSPKEAVLEVFQQFLNLGDESEEIRSIGRMESVLLDSVPVWLLENLGDEVSTQLTRQTLLAYEEGKHETV